MVHLEEAREQYTLLPFNSDGCSGNVSLAWSTAITELSKVSTSFKNLYTEVQSIPFESACVVHDMAYHKGIGGYAARLQADNTLRSAIITYGITNTQEIQQRTGLRTHEEVEIVAETVYRGVRLGGSPCTGTPYAWGFGYNNGSCD